MYKRVSCRSNRVKLPAAHRWTRLFPRTLQRSYIYRLVHLTSTGHKKVRGGWKYYWGSRWIEKGWLKLTRLNATQKRTLRNIFREVPSLWWVGNPCSYFYTRHSVQVYWSWDRTYEENIWRYGILCRGQASTSHHGNGSLLIRVALHRSN